MLTSIALRGVTLGYIDQLWRGKANGGRRLSPCVVKTEK